MFSDNTVSQLRREGGVLSSRSGMSLRLPPAAGFCQGVASAIAKLGALLEESKPEQRKLLLGEMIHNESVNQEFVRRGITLLSEEQSAALFTEAAEAETKYIIPAFGLSLELEEALRRTPQALQTDCSRPNVRRIWQQVRLGAAGQALLLHGSPHRRCCSSRVWRHAQAGAVL